ncbi:MAG: ferric reductase-like transmembrane domain-containing protein [Actinomycetota bacterium]|nr:ferric reductase-like transmembrane domain-containing protein [Actinomycetota bacterium]
MRFAVRGGAWVAVYFGVAVAPLIFALIDLDPGRGFLINLSVALGFVGLSMIGLQFALVARFERVAAPFGIDALLRLHRKISYVALTFILLHPALLVFDKSKFLGLFDVETDPWRARFAILATVGLLLLIGLSIWRRHTRLSYETWQLTHALLAVVVSVAALTHVLLVGYYVDEPWEQALWVLMSAAFIALLVWVRILKPLERRRHAWQIERIEPERGDCWTLVLRPQHHGAEPFEFEPGQFAWLIAGQSPFAITHHPFSFSSSAEQKDHVALTVKAAGDFTSRIKALAPGADVYLDGPHGSFTVDRHEASGFGLIAGGVGITPIMSIMRTLADRGDERPRYLFVCNRDWNSVTFREELDEHGSLLNCEVVYVLSDADETWAGERGHLGSELLRRHLPHGCERLQYFTCGPSAMMDAVEKALAELGVARSRVHSERFTMV